MEIFNASESFTLPAGRADTAAVRRALRAFLEFHRAEFSEDDTLTFRFAVPAFVLSSRNKPLHRFQSGQISLRELPDGQTELSFQARLSIPNIIGCVASVVLGLVLAITMLINGGTTIWWPLGAAAAGPLIAYTAKDQCVSRLRTALLEATSLAGQNN